MSDKPDVTKRQEQILEVLMAENLAGDINSAEVGGLADFELAQRLGVSEDEIRDDLKALEDLGFIEPHHISTRESSCTGQSTRALGLMISRDPIRDADTNPDIWLHALDLFEPLAAAQCYPHVFMTLLEDLEDLEGTDVTVGDLAEVLPDDDWPDLLKTHVGIIKCEPQGALKFFATEIVEQMLRRINERYPVTEGYSPVHIALAAVYRAMRAAYDEVGAAGAR
jgi:DNA-binding Lrp family transcriptional regulator